MKSSARDDERVILHPGKLNNFNVTDAQVHGEVANDGTVGQFWRGHDRISDDRQSVDFIWCKDGTYCYSVEDVV